MASVTKSSDEKSMADEKLPEQPEGRPSETDGASDESDNRSAPISYQQKAASGGEGFFTIHKKGQGYYTRLGTAIAVLGVGILTAVTLYQQIPANLLPNSISHETGLKIAGVIVAVFSLAYAFFGWKLFNRPSNVDFLIATDSEMKKVNWTSRAELIGSTKIVIIFMFLIATFLFVVDQAFGWLMYFAHVLKVSPLGT